MSSTAPDDDAAPDHELLSESKLRREVTINRLSGGASGILLAILSLGSLPCMFALLMVLYELVKKPELAHVILLIVIVPLLVLCLVALWLSWRSVNIHWHQSARSSTQLQTLRQRRKAQGGSISMAQEAQERGAIAMTADDSTRGALSDAAESTRVDFHHPKHEREDDASHAEVSATHEASQHTHKKKT